MGSLGRVEIYCKRQNPIDRDSGQSLPDCRGLNKHTDIRVPCSQCTYIPQIDLQNDVGN